MATELFLSFDSTSPQFIFDVELDPYFLCTVLGLGEPKENIPHAVSMAPFPVLVALAANETELSEDDPARLPPLAEAEDGE